MVSTETIASSVAPTASARLRLRPIDGRGAVIQDGLLAERQRVNREVTLLTGAEELERAGTLDNLRIAAGRMPGEHRGMVFSDSDVYKWLEALAWETQREPDPELERLASETTELVAAAQHADGYLNSYWGVDGRERWSDLEMGHELYCAGHLIQAGVAAARTGSPRLLGVARRFADLLVETFGSEADPAHRRTSRGRSGARRALPRDLRSSLPRARREADRPARLRLLRRRPLRSPATTRTGSLCAGLARSSATRCARCTSPPA